MSTETSAYSPAVPWEFAATTAPDTATAGTSDTSDAEPVVNKAGPAGLDTIDRLERFAPDRIHRRRGRSPGRGSTVAGVLDRVEGQPPLQRRHPQHLTRNADGGGTPTDPPPAAGAGENPTSLGEGFAWLLDTDIRRAVLGGIARDLVDSPNLWRRRVRRTTHQRWYVPLLANKHYEAWLIGWPWCEGIELHDHGNSSAAVCVIEGTLVESFADVSDPFRSNATFQRRTLPAGSLITFGPEHIHDIINPAHGQALSIHVYSPRLRSMTFYERRRDSGLVAARTRMTNSNALLV